jgi:molecular chaperone GrpE
MDSEHDIPVKVVDRRRWRDDGAVNPEAAPPASLKPSYVEELEQKVAASDKAAQEYLTKYRQASQEFEDARARMRKELGKDAERSRREVLVSLLEVVDNLDRAIDAAEQSGASDEPLLQGVRMVRQQFLGKLEGFGVSAVDAGTGRFDPELHEAIAAVPTSSPSEDGTIVGVVRRGYRIGDEVLRPALVAVARAGDAAS